MPDLEHPSTLVTTATATTIIVIPLPCRLHLGRHIRPSLFA
ncbi:proline-rich receptor-like protein kinase PERK8 [Iris pallida]|uniref:Proline-rich receptor-like protein kinase PERK8 n=1 Tax=Iris pallida TaxID=29817 RepID=A0AAX6GY02_IRIPA|nr:proline-rich receptor-like protein kinase PERK8 [Iris pallida]KAJ6833413.1 proline-rich receptor-like protein kinase PERK8 [Iris pallida]